MKVLPPRVARPSPPASQPSGPARRAPEDAALPPAAPSRARRAPGGALEAGVLVMALAGLALASTAGREPRGPGALALYVVLATPLALAGALTLPRLAARLPRGD